MGCAVSATIFWLGTKELRSFAHDWVLVGLVIYSFSLAVIAQAQSNSQELHNASIGYRGRGQFRAVAPHHPRVPAALLQDAAAGRIERCRPADQYRQIHLHHRHSSEFSARCARRPQPAIQVNIDATAMVQAGLGSGYSEQIITTEVSDFVSRAEGSPLPPVNLAMRIAFNPNVTTSWFTSVMGIINSVTMLAIIMAGAAIVREREHGTMDHLLVMPVSPFEIAMSKVWANGLVITIAVGFSLTIVVRMLLGVPIAGSVPLFLAGTALYLFFATAIGIFLGTIARSMPQLGLLYMLIAMPMNILSGTNTPLESMPPWLATIMQASPSTHFVSFAQSILYRGAGIDVVWPQFLAVAAIGGIFFAAALLRFRLAAATSEARPRFWINFGGLRFS